ARLNHGLLRRKTKPAETLIGVEQENPVFGDNADNHDDAHERSDVERGAGDEQSEESAESGKQSGSKNRSRGREAAKFKEQNNKKEHQRQDQNLEQFAERFLLLLIGAAVFDADRRRQMKTVHGLLYRGDTGAEANSFQTRRNLHEALGIFTANFRLPGIGGERSERAERSGEAGGADNGSIHHLLERAAAGVWKANTNGI